MGASRNQESTRQEKDGVVYYDRGILTGKDGRRYQRYAIHTHFVQPGEDQAELVRRYVLPLYQPGDCLSFTAKVMGMCTNNVRTLAAARALRGCGFRNHPSVRHSRPVL